MPLHRLSRGRLLIGAGVLLILVLLVAATTTTYETFRVVEQDNTTCEQYDQQCSCTGRLAVLESYPPQYQCSGIEFCRDINRTVCR